MKKICTTLLIFCSSLAIAQSACDSLDIEVKYYPFSDSFIQVNVINHSQELFGYPMFTLFDNNGDTVAKETPNFFGIGQSSQHVLKVYPGMQPSGIFTGTLQLYYYTVDSYAVCTYNVNANLCPDTCTTIYPFFGNMGGMQVIGDVAWQILNSSAQPVATGTFTLDTNNQYVIDTVCLSPGNYTMKCNNVSQNQGGQKFMGLTTYMTMAPNPQAVFNDTVVSLPFKMYESCITSTFVEQTIAEKKIMSINACGTTISIQNMQGGSIGELCVRSTDGKVLHYEKTGQARHSVRLPAIATGIYIINVRNETGSYTKKVFIGAE